MRHRRAIWLGLVAIAACGNTIDLGAPGAPTDVDAGSTTPTAGPDGSIADAGPPPRTSCSTFFDASYVPDADAPRCIDFDFTSVGAGPHLFFDDVWASEDGGDYSLADSPIPTAGKAFRVDPSATAPVIGRLNVQPPRLGVTVEADVAIQSMTWMQSGLVLLQFAAKPNGVDTSKCARTVGIGAMLNDGVSYRIGIMGPVPFAALEVVPIGQTFHLTVRLDEVPANAPADEAGMYTLTSHLRVDDGAETEGPPLQFSTTCRDTSTVTVEVGSIASGGGETLDARFDNVTYRNE